MDLVKLFEHMRSGVVQVFHIRNSNLLGAGTGFFVKGKLVTNYHVAGAALIPANSNDLIGLRFHDSPPNQARCVLKCDEFAKRVRAVSEEHSFDYLVADWPEALVGGPHQFEFASEELPLVGQQVAFQGYPFGQTHLASHAGYVSSIHSSGVATMIQLDASVNSGNSGGPLVEIKNGLVVGVISRKETGLSKQFKELRAVLHNNIKMLEANQASGKRMAIAGIDPIQVIMATEQQLAGVANEIERSANVGIGFAVKVTALRNEGTFLG